jgi:hypothetical protein
MYLTGRRRDTLRDYISPDQSSRAKSPVNSIQLDGRQSSKIAQFEESRWQATSRSPGSNQRSLVKGNLLVEDDIGEGGHPAGTGQPCLYQQFLMHLQARYDF